MPTKPPTIKSLQANIRTLKAEAKINEAHVKDLELIVREKNEAIDVLDVQRDNLWDECKKLQKSRTVLQTNATEWREKSVKLSDELQAIKSKWWYKIFAK